MNAYYWSVVIMAFLLVILGISVFLMASGMMYVPPLLKVLLGLMALYVVVGTFIQGRDRE